MRLSRVKERWGQGKPAFCTTITFMDPCVAELVSLMGIDCIWLDMEHHVTSVETACQIMRAIRLGVSDVMARPGKGEFMRMGRMLEAGAQGILYPRCDNETEAREVVRWAKFAPLGERGFDGGNPDSPYGSMSMAEYVKMANEQTFLLIQIESPAAVPHARAIAEVEGVDVVFFGPGDFSVLSGVPGDFENPIVQNALKTVCKETLAAGKRFGTLVFSADQAKRVLDMGGTFICYGADLPLLKQAYVNMRSVFSELGFIFEDRLSSQQSSYGVAR